MNRKIIVAVDGPAGSGKSSISKEVAGKAGLTYIDSGAIYRSITWYFLQKCGPVNREMDFKNMLTFEVAQDFTPDGASRTYVDGRDVSALIRSEEIAANIGIISDDIDIRNFVNKLLRKFSESRSIIMDGRDIGTVVFPDADLKIFLDASVEIRARRRMMEYQEMGKNVDENRIKNQIILRDEQDKKRPFGALIRARDAVYLDTSGMNKEMVVEKVLCLVSDVQKKASVHSTGDTIKSGGIR
jgi:cytidylate kinase